MVTYSLTMLCEAGGSPWLTCKARWLPGYKGLRTQYSEALIQPSDGRGEMTSILRNPQALQLTLALIKPDAVAHPLILEVRMNLHLHCPVLDAIGPFGTAQSCARC